MDAFFGWFLMPQVTAQAPNFKDFGVRLRFVKPKVNIIT